MSCIHCRKETDEKYIIDARGTEYCSEDCMEKCQDKHDISFEPHPYEDTYLILRRGYIKLLDTWEQTLSKTNRNLEDAAEEILEEIDELIGEYDDFIRAEGDDGSYAWEIYQYTIKLRKLQEPILAWRPTRQMLYWVTSERGKNNCMNKEDEKIYSDIFADIFAYAIDHYIPYVMENHQHPYQEGLNYVFDNLELAVVGCEVFQSFCDKYGVELFIEEAYKCEGRCGDILEANADTNINGWFYCYSCKESDDYGIFTPQELETELQYYEDDEDERQIVIYERRDWCYPYKKKVKRSCRAFDVEVPAWAE